MYFRMLRLEVMINRKRLGLLILAGVGVALVMGVSFYVWHYIKAPFDNKIIPSFWDQLAYFIAAFHRLRQVDRNLLKCRLPI